MICERCQQPISKDQMYKAYPIHSPSGAGTTVHIHERKCRPVPSQTAPSGVGR